MLEKLRPQRALKLLVLFLIWATYTTSGCTSTLRNEQLENVAKDWALVIRASQVIPVYPLTEDLQPGDVLLVSTPIEDQVTLYKAKGFLPLDQHLIRLYPPDFQAFYNSRYGITDATIPPAQWQIQDGNGTHHWKVAPRAAFPTYQFSVTTGSGLNLAIPIHGIPFALGLMNSGKASGTVTLADAFTYGLDNVHLTALVQGWADKNRSFLRKYSPYEKHSQFLRVVSRVYVTGQVSVTVNNDDATSAEVRGGADRPVELLGITKGATDKNYSDAISTINKFVSDTLPGGKVKIATASSRSVTLSETFPRPLVIGYVGFDMQVFEGGRLGPPISTLTQLTAERVIPAQGSDGTYRIAALSHMYRALSELKGPESDSIRKDLDSLAEQLPSKYPFSLYEFSAPGVLQRDRTVTEGASLDRHAFSDVLAYLANAKTTVTTLGSHLAKARESTQAERETIAALERDRQAAQTAYEQISKNFSSSPALMRAIDFVFLQQ